MLMSNLVSDSPMFDFVEQIAGRPTPKAFSASEKQEQELERKAKMIRDKDQLEKAEQMQFEDNEDDAELARMNIDA